MNPELEKERRSDVITAVVVTLLAWLLAMFATGGVVLPWGPYVGLVGFVGCFMSGWVAGRWDVPRVVCWICRASPPGPIPWYCDECKRREGSEKGTDGKEG